MYSLKWKQPTLLSALSLLVGASATLDAVNPIRWVNCSENVPSAAGLDLTGVDLVNLPPALHCGQLDVPMDYSRPQGPNNTVTLGLAMVRPANPKGVLFVYVGHQFI